jgi:rod shape-determining protein MreB
MHGTIPSEEDQITLTTAGDYLDEVFHKLITQNHKDVQITINMAREIKERFSFVHDIQERAEVMLPVAGKPTKVDVTNELKIACQMVVPPMVDALRQLIATFDPEFQQRMMNNIILAGGGSQLRGLDRLVEEALREYGGGRVKRVNEPVFAGANGALKLATEMPKDFWAELHR